MDPSSSSSSNKRKRDLNCYDEPRYKRPKYDVFVNYASEDIGKRFASHLKRALIGNGFSISDHTMLPLGKDESSELLKAIEDSEIYLLLFSNEYASSVRCLEEFSLIMESYPKFKHRKVLPVFFNVEPTDVKNQQGPFLDAFKDHETKVDPNKVQNWRQALREAGHLSGLPFQDGDEAEFVHKILKDVRNMQNPQQLCNVNHLVGIESRAQDIISALRLGEQTFTIVAVLGFSGTGKSASAKAVYDMIAPEFDASCFIQNMRSYINREADLQKDVISYLTGNDTIIARHNDGAARIKKLMSSRKALLILDDIYDSDQLEALVTDSASFHSGSRIIVTTINKQSLSCLSSYTPYNIRLLDDSESFQLFTGLTFGEQDTVEKNFVDEIVWRAGGIPLVLKVWSRHFRDNERKLWPSMLETLKRIPHEDTQKKLRIIYDLLPKRAQNLFLDIACFFDGMDKDLVVQVLQDEDFFPDFEIQNLVNKFLVKNGSSWIRLHDVIREMGQEVVRQEDEDEPGKRTRLMGYRDVVRVLGDCSGTNSVRSIQLFSSEKKECITVQLEAFKKMSNLRFIKLANPNMKWSSCSNDDMSCYTFKHLKYLEWWYFPCKSLDNFDMGHVVVIKLRSSKLEKLWEGANKSFKKLKILDVEGSRFLTKTGNFIGVDNLEKLSLSDCSNLEELDSSIGCLQKLVELNLSCCTRLKSLSWEMISKLTSLQKLSLFNCTNLLEISDAAGSPISLKHLDLTGTMIISLPDSLCQLHQLTFLQLNNCTNLKSIPDLPPSIEKLYVHGCRNLSSLPNSICQLHQLTFLQLNKCTNLKSIPDLPPSIEKLYVFDCINLSSLPNSICQLHQLTDIDFRGCTNLKSIPDLPPSIETLYVFDCINLVNLPSNCSELQFLTALMLCDCSKLGDEGFTQVTGLRNLQSLGMQNCNVSQVSSGIGNLVSLRILCLSGNTFSSLPETFSNLSKLEQLYINDCSQLQLLPPLPSQLKFIGASNCGYSMQNAYIFPSKAFKESQLMINEGLLITLSWEELPEWCTYRSSGNVLSFVAPIQIDHNKICGLILCATRDKDGEYEDDEYEDDEYEDYEYEEWIVPRIYNKTKGTSYLFHDLYPHEDYEYDENYEEWVMFYPLDDTTLVVEAGDTVEVELDGRNKSCGLRLIYEDDVVDMGLVLKDVREPLIPTSEMSAGIIQLSGDDDVHVNDDGLIIQDVTNPTLPVFPSPESEIMSGIITQLNDMEVYSSVQDVEYPCYDYFNVVPEFQMYWEGNW